MSALTRVAAGQPCMVRVPGYCNHDPATTVLAHVRLAGITGTGLRAPDLLGAWACSACHDLIDGRVRIEIWSRSALTHMHYEGVLRTIARLIEMGRIKA